MSHDEGHFSQGRAGECRPLLEACTPVVYRHNVFRITGLFTDASVRDVKRRVDDLKHAEQMGDAEEEHSHAFALDPPPDRESIRNAALRLQDPERRIVEEFFWFWPMEWGKGKYDPALIALTNGDKKSAYNTWKQELSSDDSVASITCKHNLAIYYQLVALDGELQCLERNLSEKSLAMIERFWRISFGHWEELTEDETFWGLVTNRIRSLDDPRLTTGFARRMRATLPEAMDKINGLLAMQLIEKGKLELARKHIGYMKETHQGLDDVSKTLAEITTPLQTRIGDAIRKSTQTAEHQPERAAQAARELFRMVSEPLEIVRSILPQKDHIRIDLCDAVAEAGLTCQIAFAREQRDWKQCLSILEEAQNFAESEETQKRIAEQSRLVQGAELLDPIFQACEKALSVAQESPRHSVSETGQLLSRTRSMIARLSETAVPDDLISRAKDEVAGTVMQCAVLFGNETEKWEPCIELLEASLQIVASSELKERISKNLHTVTQNARVFGNLTPISSAPPLTNIYGIGFSLYGETDRDRGTDSYLSTYYFVFMFIPIFPICRYRVIRTDKSYNFLGKAPLRVFDIYHFVISIVLIFLLFLYANLEPTSRSSTSSSSRSSTVPSSSRPSIVPSSPRPSEESRSRRSVLGREIENLRRQVEVIEAQLGDMDQQQEDYENRMNQYEASNMNDEYNRLVPVYNSLLNERKKLSEEYNRLIDEGNAKVNRYNSEIR